MSEAAKILFDFSLGIFFTSPEKESSNRRPANINNNQNPDKRGTKLPDFN